MYTLSTFKTVEKTEESYQVKAHYPKHEKILHLFKVLRIERNKL